MDWLYVTGRILFSLIFIGGGITHFAKLNATAQYAQSKKVPAPKLMVAVAGLMLLAGGLSVLLGVYMELGTWLMVLFLVPTAFTIHNFWATSDPVQKEVDLQLFMKNISMTGAALMLYWMVQVYGYGPFTLGRPMM
jgi:putative oxidoreductase